MPAGSPSRAKVKAEDLHVGDYLTFASRVVVKVERGHRFVVVSCRGALPPGVVYRWLADTPVWVRTPRRRIEG